MKKPQDKGQYWDRPEKLLEAVEKASDANIPGLELDHKKFPTPRDGSDNWVLKNAKQYQAEGSGDANLSFKLNGVSFDDVDPKTGQLIDRKWGHDKAIFDADGEVINEVREASIVKQAKAQLDSVGGDASKLRWEISTEGGANGIRNIFIQNGWNIQVEYVPQVKKL